MRKAKIINNNNGHEPIVEVLSIEADGDYKYCICKLPDNRLYEVDIKGLEFIDEPEKLSKDTQAQAILFEGQCRLNAMLINNKQREIANNDVFNYSWDDFMGLQEEIERRINDLNKEK